jgi:hypothetical protein
LILPLLRLRRHNEFLSWINVNASRVSRVYGTGRQFDRMDDQVATWFLVRIEAAFGSDATYRSSNSSTNHRFRPLLLWRTWSFHSHRELLMLSPFDEIVTPSLSRVEN